MMMMIIQSFTFFVVVMIAVIVVVVTSAQEATTITSNTKSSSSASSSSLSSSFDTFHAGAASVSNAAVVAGDVDSGMDSAAFAEWQKNRNNYGTISMSRAQRFPSIEQRVKVYMSNWYTPPCDNYTEGFIYYSYNHHPSPNDKNHNHAAATAAMQNSSTSTTTSSSHTVLHLKSYYRPPRVLLKQQQHQKHHLSTTSSNNNNNEDKQPTTSTTTATSNKHHHHHHHHHVDEKFMLLSHLATLDYYVVHPTILPDQVFFVRTPELMDCAGTTTSDGSASASAEDTANAAANNKMSQQLPKQQQQQQPMIKGSQNMRMYCQDTVQSLQVAWDHIHMEYAQQQRRRNQQNENHKSNSNNHPAQDNQNGNDIDDIYDIPLLLQYGDMKTTHIYGRLELPHIKKFRSAISFSRFHNNYNDHVQQVETAVASGADDMASSTTSTTTSTRTASTTRSSNFESPADCLLHPPHPLRTVHGTSILQPILWKLATHRHYRLLHKVYREDTPWAQKRPQAIFRGQLTGSLDFYNKSLSHLDNCLLSWRCKLVYQHAHSPWIDAKLTSTRGRLPSVLHQVNMTSPTVTLRHLLQYKAVIMLEGNDVASGLKWALLSQSVVMMPPPRHSSWAMEELLQPWVHYIPLLPDASDVEEKMKWIVHHDAQAQWIAEQGSLWIEDLVFHPDAANDDRYIQEDMIRRYRAHFRPIL